MKDVIACENGASVAGQVCVAESSSTRKAERRRGIIDHVQFLPMTTDTESYSPYFRHLGRGQCYILRCWGEYITFRDSPCYSPRSGMA